MIQQIIQIANITPEQLNEVVRQAVRSELDSCGMTKSIQMVDEIQHPDFLTRKETAKLLRISLVTLHKLTTEGILQSLTIHGNVRYRRQDVVEAMKEVKNGRTKR
ncbi:helix-turn-helix domain-containing protein [Spirosoma sp. SC4-14]|uniref:helix-turn-helix domain-containing protein n=1 Tax=Spirosoma sp. SC4-14 TaxID=3128900 RepID=UPI0030D17BFE